MIIAATGHRPNKLGGYTDAILQHLADGAARYLEEQRPDKVISGMALGWDMAWALAAWRLKIPFIAAIPFNGQQLVWPERAQQQWGALKREAAEVVVVCRGDYAPWKMHVRNQWMVDHSDKVCALWDGSAGGTFNCITYARRQGKPIDNLWDEFAAARGAA